MTNMNFKMETSQKFFIFYLFQLSISFVACKHALISYANKLKLLI